MTNAAVPTSIYLPKHVHKQAQAAYLYDYQHNPDLATWQQWLTHSLEQHANRTPPEREQWLYQPTHGPGYCRQFMIPADTITKLDQAIEADQAAGHFPSRSSWCVAALQASIHDATERAGKPLPAPPPRLPRLKRSVDTQTPDEK